ncbi:MAG: class I SAM-dependent methyltransferase [Leptolyngbya sp. SIOISBB]|nr:class I SAM-dependent methyltransferase [Leptolyngbya sp. SIOISBB]
MNELVSIIKSFIRRILFVLDPLYVASYKLTQPHSKHIPPMKRRVRVGNHYRIDTFLNSGLRCYEPLKQAIKTYQANQLEGLRILDFGAGCGRTLQYSSRDFDKIWATDIDAEAINFVARDYPEVVASCNTYDPPTDYEENFFDVIYSVSIWTHIPPVSQEAWLQEIQRILKKDGLALITFLGENCLQNESFHQTYDFNLTPEFLVEKGLIYIEYPRILKRNSISQTGQPYGVTYHSNEYISKVWSQWFDVLNIQKSVIDNLQNLAILKKR